MSKTNFEIKKLTDREHIIHRPSMYIGSVSNETHEVQIFEDKDDNLILCTKQLTYTPGLIKIINEVIDNSVDAIIKTKVGNEIKVLISESMVTVTDNSAGFPSPKNKKVSHPEEIPMILALGNARAGSNFNDQDNLGQMGTNGVGAFATNCFSSFFDVKSTNVEFTMHATWCDNAILSEYKIQSAKGKTGTAVNFKPDLSKFGMKIIDDAVLQIIKTRLTVLALTYPDIKFSFNSNKIKTPKKLSELFTESETPYVQHKTDNYEVLVIANSEKTNHFSVVNGLQTPDGGSHIDLILQEIVKELQDAKGLKCTRADVLNTLQIVFVGKQWKNLRFNSQTKEKITNSTKETRDYLGDISSLVDKVKKSKAIKDFIKASTQARELRADKKALKDAKKTKIKSDKFLDAQGDRKILMLVEGDSAMGGLVPALGRKNIAYYALKGKPLNAWKSTTQKVAANKELSELLAIIHQNDFEKVVIAADSDADGAHIVGLLIGFVYKFLPEYKEKLYRLRTPVKSAMKSGKITRWVYNLNENLDLKSQETLYYLKGLGSWTSEDLQCVVKTDGFEILLAHINFGGSSGDVLERWLGDDSQIRKEMIQDNEFSIAGI